MSIGNPSGAFQLPEEQTARRRNRIRKAYMHEENAASNALACTTHPHCCCIEEKEKNLPER